MSRPDRPEGLSPRLAAYVREVLPKGMKSTADAQRLLSAVTRDLLRGIIERREASTIIRRVDILIRELQKTFRQRSQKSH